MTVGGVISPDKFPVPTLMPARLEYRAGRLRANAALVAEAGHDIKGSWAGLSAVYTAPEAETLFAVVDPVAVDGDGVSVGMDRAATALEVFAEEVRGIKERWATLTSDTDAFLASIEGDDDWRKADAFSGEWWSGDESPKVAEHQALLDRADALRLEYEAAEVECANAVNAGLPVRTNFVHADSGTEPAVRQYEHGYNEYLGDMDMPWGGSMETDHAWFVDVGHSVSDFAVGAVEDLGGRFGAHSSEGWFEMNMGDALVEYHGTNLTNLGAMAGLYDPATGEWGEVGWETFGNTWTEVAHSVVPWREWDDRPGYVIGTAALNIGSVVAGVALTATGLGAVVGVPLLLWRGSAMINKVDLPDMADADGAGNGVDADPRFNLPYFGGLGSTPAGFHLDLPDLRGSLSPSETAELQGALDRLENWSPEPADGSGSPTDPTAQDLADGMTVEDVLNPVSAESTRLRDEYGDDFGALDRDADGDGSGTGDGSDSGDGGRVPALVGPRSDAEEGAGTPDTSPDWTIDLTGGGFDRPGDRTGGEGADLGDRGPTVNDSVGDGGGTADSPFPDGGGSVHHTDGPGFSSDGHGGGSDRNGDGVDDPPPGIDLGGGSDGRDPNPPYDPWSPPDDAPGVDEQLGGLDPASARPEEMTHSNRKPWPVEFGHTDASGRWFDDTGLAHIEPPALAEHARTYNRIRGLEGDTAGIAENFGIDRSVMDRIKEHIFLRDHWVAVGPNDVRYGRFTPMFTIAESWERAANGTLPPSEHDDFRRWLRHEAVESRLMEWGMPYLSSDPAAFPWDAVYESHAPRATVDHYGAHDLAPAENFPGAYDHYLDGWNAPETQPNADLSNSDEIAREIFERFYKR